MIHKFIYKTLTVRSDMFNKNKDEIQILKSKVAELTTQVNRLTTAIQNIHKRKQSEKKVNDSKLTPTAEELATKHELDFLRRRTG
jgi:molecular chaperone GrpE (heat shock protein)